MKCLINLILFAKIFSVLYIKMCFKIVILMFYSQNSRHHRASDRSEEPPEAPLARSGLQHLH